MKRENRRQYFYQWELDQRLIVAGDCTMVHFANGTRKEALSCEVFEENDVRLVNVPNELLQTAADLQCYAWDEKSTSVTEHMTFPVMPREKPADYVYTPTEVKRYNLLEEQLKVLADSAVGRKTAEGGEIFGDYETNRATAKYSATFGSGNKADGECSISGGARIFKSGAEYVVAQEYFDGEVGWTLLAYAADPNGEYAKNTISFDSAKSDLPMEAGKTYECWMDVAEWVAEQEEYGSPVPDMIMTADGRFCLLEDLRYNEAYGTGAMSIGKGAVAYSRASKSFGYRTQTGYPPSPEIAALRPEVIVLKDENGNPVYPEDNVGQGAVAIGADTAALRNHGFAGGWGAISWANNAFSFGDHTEACADHSVALNYRTKANAIGAISAGSGTVNDGKYSIGGGLNGYISGNYSFGIGMKYNILAHFCITSGMENIVQANCAAAFGAGLVTAAQFDANGNNINNGYAQTLVGQYNAYKNGELNDALFAVGNGTSDSNRKNALSVHKNGSVKVAGKLSFGSIDEESRKKIVQNKSSYNEPTINDKGDYIGQIWLRINEEYDTTAEVYMYVGVNLGGYYWKKLL